VIENPKQEFTVLARHGPPQPVRHLCLSQPLLDIVLYNALFFTSLALSSAAMAASVPCFADERAVFLREKRAGASVAAYVIGKVRCGKSRVQNVRDNASTLQKHVGLKKMRKTPSIHKMYVD
jgi:hypothetical protein